MDPFGHWVDQPLAIVDLETTGFSPEFDRIVEIGIVRVENRRVVESWATLVDPGRRIPYGAQKAHGIGEIDVCGKDKLLVHLPTILRLTRGALPVAYSAEFDRRMLRAEMLRMELEMPIGLPHHAAFDERWPWIDPLVWIRTLDNVQNSNTLAEACGRFGIPTGISHRARDDAEATAMLLLALAPRIGKMTATQLIAQQRETAARRKAG